MMKQEMSYNIIRPLTKKNPRTDGRRRRRHPMNDHEQQQQQDRNIRRRLSFEQDENEQHGDNNENHPNTPKMTSSSPNSRSSSSSLATSPTTSPPQEKDPSATATTTCAHTPYNVSLQDRYQMIRWTYTIVDHFDFDRNVVAITWNYVDRYIMILTNQEQQEISTRTTSPESSSSHNFQLLVVTCLYLALKLHGVCGTTGSSPSSSSSDDNDSTTTTKTTPSCKEDEMKTNTKAPASGTASTANASISLDYMVSLTYGRITASQLEDMEYHICTTLNWYLHPPTAKDILYQAVKNVATTSTECSTTPKQQQEQSSSFPHSPKTPHEETDNLQTLLERNHLLGRAIYITELALFQPSLRHVQQSLLAFAALEIVVSQSSATPTIRQSVKQVLEQFWHYQKEEEDIHQVRFDIQELYQTQICASSSTTSTSSTSTTTASSSYCSSASMTSPSDDGRSTPTKTTPSSSHKKNDTPSSSDIVQEMLQSPSMTAIAAPTTSSSSTPKEERFSSPVCVIVME